MGGGARHMRVLVRVLATAIAILLAGTAPALADPVSITVALVTFLSSPIGQIVLAVALQVGSSLLAKSRAAKEPVGGVRTQVQIGGDVPVSVLLGRRATAGSRVYAGTWDAPGGSKNEYFVDVISLSDLPVAGLSGLIIDGEPVTIDMEADEQAQGFPVLEYRGNGKDNLWVRFCDGSQTTADAYLRDKFGSDPEMPWTADMIGRGVAYAIITARLNRYFFRSVPQALFVGDGFKCYDPRKDTSAGGAGSHRRDDPSTWEATSNLAVIAHQLFMGLYWDLGGVAQWVHGAQGLPAARLPFASWVAAMNECDTAIDLDGGGTEPQFVGGIEVIGKESVADILDELMKCCSGRLVETSAAYKCTIGIPPSAVWAMSDGDIIITEGQSYEPFPGLEATTNTINATYPEPGEAWQTKSAPERSDTTMITADGGRRLAADIAYRAVSSGTQVQRLAATALADSRRFRTHAVSLPPQAWLLEPGDVIAWTSARNGYAAKKFMITQMAGRRTFVQQVALKEVDPGDQDWSPGDDEMAFDVTPVSPLRPAAQAMSGWSVAPATIGDANGTARRPAIEVSFAGGLADIRAVAVQIRVAATAQLIFDGEMPYDDAIEAPSAVIGQNILPVCDYQARGRFLPFSARETEWGGWLSVTTGDVRFETSDLAAAVNSAIRAMRAELAELRDTLPGGFTSAFITEGDALRWRQGLRTRVGATEAAVALEAEARADGDSANAALIGAVSAVADDATAEGLIKLEASAAPSGVTARFGTYLRAAVEDSYDAEAAFFLDVLDGGGTRAAFVVDQFSIWDGSSAVVPFYVDGGTTYLQNVVVGGSLIAESSITGDRIIDGAITGKAQVSQFASNTAWSGSVNVWNDVPGSISVTIDVADGAYVLVGGWAVFSHGNAEPYIDMRIVRDGAEIISGAYTRATDLQNSEQGGAYHTMTKLLIDEPSAGSRTYKLQWRIDTSAATIRNRYLFAVQFRK